MSAEPSPNEEHESDLADEEALGGPDGGRRIAEVIAQQFGEQAAQRFGDLWRSFDEWSQNSESNLAEGLRERKKRLTRQRISDIATAMFIGRGFDNVKVSELAELAGVSEKTIYNYFPTKESLVFDQATDQRARLTDAVRDRPAGTAPSTAFVEALKAESARFSQAVGDRIEFLMRFALMIRSTPSLRAAWSEHRHQVVEELRDILAEESGVDPRDPEPLVVARGLVSLLELYYDSQMRHVSDGVTDPAKLRAAIEADLDRGARLLETGFWSLQLLVEGHRTKAQLRDAALAAEQARQQVLSALRDAKRAWQAIRQEARNAGRDAARAAAQERREQVRAAVQAKHAQAREQARAKHAEARERARMRQRPDR